MATPNEIDNLLGETLAAMCELRAGPRPFVSRDNFLTGHKAARLDAGCEISVAITELEKVAAYWQVYVLPVQPPPASDDDAMNRTSIPWTDFTSNPIRASHTGRTGWACVKPSEGCANCYAESLNRRFGTGLPYGNAGVSFFVDDNELRRRHRRRKPTAVRFVSLEPMLGPVDPRLESVDWVIVGCESGRRRRPFESEWARRVLAQCRQAGVPFFMKQMALGRGVTDDVALFPPDLQAREWPAKS